MIVSSRLGRSALLGLLLLPLCPTFLSAQAGRTAAKRAAENDIRESVIRYQMKDFHSDIFFVEINGKDPSDNLMERFGDIPGIVEKVSSSVFSKERMGVVDKSTGRTGTILQAGRIRWLTKESVAVEGGYYCGALCAAGILFKVESKRGKWLVTSSHVWWIS